MKIKLSKRSLLASRLMNNVRFFSFTWLTDKKGNMLALGWALTKHDWWKTKGSAEAKFFSVQWKYPSGKYNRTAIYIGRFAAIYQFKKRGDGH